MNIFYSFQGTLRRETWRKGSFHSFKASLFGLTVDNVLITAFITSENKGSVNTVSNGRTSLSATVCACVCELFPQNFLQFWNNANSLCLFASKFGDTELYQNVSDCFSSH